MRIILFALLIVALGCLITQPSGTPACEKLGAAPALWRGAC